MDTTYSSKSYELSSEFLSLRDQIINWNNVMEAYQGDNDYNLLEVRRNALAIAHSIPGNKPGEQLDVNGSLVEWVFYKDKTDTNILYIHGGGFIAGSVDNHRPFAKALSKYLKANILMVDYPLAPEYPYPIPIDICIESYKLMLSIVPKTSYIGIIGDSAGANLALSMMLRLRDENYEKLPDFAVLLSGFFDLSLNSGSIYDKINEDVVLKPEFLNLSSLSYSGDTDTNNPYVSPIYGDFTNFPSLFFQVGSSEILLDDSIRCHEIALKYGVDSTISIWPGMIHSFQSYYKCIPEAVGALKEINDFIDSHI